MSQPDTTVGGMLYDAYDHSWGPTTRPPYGRAPYVRITMDDGRQFDGQATAWTTDKVHVKWPDYGAPPRKVAWMTTHMHLSWMDAYHVQQIKRSESSWHDVYDDYDYFDEQGEL